MISVPRFKTIRRINSPRSTKRMAPIVVTTSFCVNLATRLHVISSKSQTIEQIVRSMINLLQIYENLRILVQNFPASNVYVKMTDKIYPATQSLRFTMAFLRVNDRGPHFHHSLSKI